MPFSSCQRVFLNYYRQNFRLQFDLRICQHSPWLAQNLRKFHSPLPLDPFYTPENELGTDWYTSTWDAQNSQSSLNPLLSQLWPGHAKFHLKEQHAAKDPARAHSWTTPDILDPAFPALSPMIASTLDRVLPCLLETLSWYVW
jgi:hypothetical protein